MKYINQLEYSHIPYRTNVLRKEYTEEQKMRNVALSGCGPCCVCMIIDMLTTTHLEIEDCIKISEECVANYAVGTDMNILGPVIAQKFNIEYSKTNDVNKAITHLKHGGQVIAHVCVPKDAKIGLLTKAEHYVLIVSTDEKDFCVIDPAYTKEKYSVPERSAVINTSHAPYLYCDIQTFHSQTIEGGNNIKYHMFARKK